MLKGIQLGSRRLGGLQEVRFQIDDPVPLTNFVSEVRPCKNCWHPKPLSSSPKTGAYSAHRISFATISETSKIDYETLETGDLQQV